MRPDRVGAILVTTPVNNHRGLAIRDLGKAIKSDWAQCWSSKYLGVLERLGATCSMQVTPYLGQTILPVWQSAAVTRKRV